MKFSILVSAFLTLMTAAQAFAADDVTIDTPRGAKVNIKIHKGNGTNLPLLVVAPGHTLPVPW
jgi:hypothetical protein